MDTIKDLLEATAPPAWVEDTVCEDDLSAYRLGPAAEVELAGEAEPLHVRLVQWVDLDTADGRPRLSFGPVLVLMHGTLLTDASALALRKTLGDVLSQAGR